MADLAKRLKALEAEAESVRRKIAAATCEEVGSHDWRHIGGRNAGCGPDCHCSVPVHECARCGACDYGANEDAREAIKSCIPGLMD